MKNETRRISVSILNDEIKEGSALITCASFESRSLYISENISKEKIKKSYVFSTDEIDPIREAREQLSSLLQDPTIIIVDKSDPFSCQKKAFDVVHELISIGIKQVLVDTSTFTHEMLLILLNVLWRKRSFFEEIVFAYTGADEYCPNTKEKWLSKGCREVRSILGYPGLLVPRKQICLIVLVGFEYERALGLIDAVDPDLLYMGCGIVCSEHVVSEHHMEPMSQFNNLHKTLLSSRENVCTFDFSARDISSTISAVEDILKRTEDYNHIIVPMNTKMSTLAVGMIALANPAIQVCYAEPETYNYENYSSCGDSVLRYMWDKKYMSVISSNN